jgi:Dockerin type I domain
MRKNITLIGLRSALLPSALAAAVTVGITRGASAQVLWDNPGEGLWSDATNWNNDVIPGASETARIANGGTAIIDSTQNVSTGFAEMGPTAGTTGTLRMTGGMLTTNFDIRVGGNAAGGGGSGTMEQSGGDIFMNGGNFVVGFGSAGAVGTYTLSGGTVKVNSSTIAAFGNRGAGTVNQTGGSFYVRGAMTPGTGIIQLGRNATTAAGSGSSTLSGGEAAAARVLFGSAVATPAGSVNTLNLQGTGQLTTGEVSVINTNATNTFNFTGGTLTATTVNIPVTNNGGTLSPAALNFGAAGSPPPDTIAGITTSPAGTTTLSGANTYTQTAAGALALDIVSATSFDTVAVGGAASLNGRLDIRPAAGFNSPGLQSYQVMTFPSRTGTFSTYSGFQNAGNGQYYAPIYSDTDLKLIATLPGDANTDGAVNGTDFALLAGNFGRTGQMWPTGDFNLDGAVNGTDFALLAGNFGRTVTQGAVVDLAAWDWASLEAFGASVGVPVPEPTAGGLLAAVAGGALLRRRRR